MPSLNTQILSSLPIIHPSMPEQRTIAHILGALDDKIELNRQMNETLEEMDTGRCSKLGFWISAQSAAK